MALSTHIHIMKVRTEESWSVISASALPSFYHLAILPLNSTSGKQVWFQSISPRVPPSILKHPQIPATPPLYKLFAPKPFTPPCITITRRFDTTSFRARPFTNMAIYWNVRLRGQLTRFIVGSGCGTVGIVFSIWDQKYQATGFLIELLLSLLLHMHYKH